MNILADAVANIAADKGDFEVQHRGLERLSMKNKFVNTDTHTDGPYKMRSKLSASAFFVTMLENVG